MINELTQFNTAIHTATPVVPDALTAGAVDQVVVRNQLYTVVDKTTSDSDATNFTDNNAILRGVQAGAAFVSPTATQISKLSGGFLGDFAAYRTLATSAASTASEAAVLPQRSNLSNQVGITGDALDNLRLPAHNNDFPNDGLRGGGDDLSTNNYAVANGVVGGTPNALGTVDSNAFASPQLVDFPDSNGLGLTSPVLPALPTASAFWTAATTAQYAGYTAPAAWTAAATTVNTKGAYVLNATTADGAKLTIQENTAGTAPFDGNGSVSEVVTFTQGDARLTVASSTSSANSNQAVTDEANLSLRETEFASASDALTHSRSVTFTSAGIASVYKLSTSHAFVETVGGQSLNDKAAESYVYSDAGLKINSAINHEVSGRTSPVTGAEALKSVDSANYSYKLGDVNLVYAANQQKVAATTGAVTTDTTTVNAAAFNYVTPNTVADRSLTVTANGVAVHRQTFNDNNAAATLNVANAPALTQTSDTWNAQTTKMTLVTTDFEMTSARMGRTLDDLLVASNAFIANGENAITSNTAAKNAFGDPIAVKAVALKATFIVENDVNGNGIVDSFTLNATDGNDVIKLKESTIADVTPAILNNNVNGDTGNDVITGNTANNILHGDLGNDTLNGGLGIDTLFGDEGTDVLNGGLGDDKLSGGTGNDSLDGNEGDDLLFGGLGNDTLNGGLDNDQLNGDAGSDLLNGGVGDDVLNGFSGNDLLNGDEGNDKLSGGTGNDTIKGGAGDDSMLNGNDGNDSIEGNDGNDVLRGNAGNDTLTGGGGTDTLTGGAGKDVLTGGADADTFVFAVGVTDTVATATSIVGVDSITDLTLNAATADLIDLTVVVANVGTLVTGSVSEATFVTDMNTLLSTAGNGFATNVGGIDAAVVTANSGDLNARQFLAVDLDASDSFTVADFVIEITGTGATLTSVTPASFI